MYALNERTKKLTLNSYCHKHNLDLGKKPVVPMRPVAREPPWSGPFIRPTVL